MTPNNCPFCGSSSVSLLEYCGGWCVECQDCFASGPWSKHECKLSKEPLTKEEAVERWNTIIPITAPPPAIVEVTPNAVPEFTRPYLSTVRTEP